MENSGLIKCIWNYSPQKKISRLLTNSQVGSLALGKDPSLGAHPHKSERFGLADRSDSRINLLDS